MAWKNNKKRCLLRLMPAIKKLFLYLLIPLDLLALLALSDLAQCMGIESEACRNGESSPSGLIVIVAMIATGFYFYRRYREKKPLLPFSLSLRTVDRKNAARAVPKTYTPIQNRIFFGFCSLMMMMSYFVMVYHYANGADTPPYAHWSFYTLPLLAGLVLITLREEIVLRVHPFWTPFGLLYVVLAWALVIFDGLPQGAAFGYSLFDSIGEGVWFATGLGLMLAFVGLGPMYRRIFYFVPLAFFGGVFGGIEFVRQVNVLVEQKPIEWGAYLDLSWLMGGYFVLFLLVKRLIQDRPPVRIMAKATVMFVVLVVLNTIISQGLIGRFFPINSWPHHWLRGYMPAYDMQCSGVDCSNIKYREPYSFCVNGNSINRGNPTTFYEVAQAKATKRCRYELNLDTNNMKIICPHKIIANNVNSVDTPVVSCDNAQYDGAYGVGLGGSQFRQKELYD